MLVSSNPSLCKTCNRQSGGRKSFSQKIILSILLSLFVIPGLIYFFVASPKLCFICGLKKTSDQN